MKPDVSAFRTRHLKQLREIAKRRGISVSAMMEEAATSIVLKEKSTDLRAIRDRCMNAVGDLAWTKLNSPERDEVIQRLQKALADFDEALDKVGL